MLTDEQLEAARAAFDAADILVAWVMDNMQEQGSQQSTSTLYSLRHLKITIASVIDNAS